MRLVTHKDLFVLSLLFFLLAVTDNALGQQIGASGAAAARTRYLSEAGMLPASREVVVEEFINYHRHQLAAPRSGESVALDLRWGNNQAFGEGNEAVLQVGFSTALATDREQLRPVNLAVVIDKSGSMVASDKMSRVQSALIAMVSRLRDVDVLSIVVFDTDAQVLLPAQRVIDRGMINQAIRRIAPYGTTNLHAGLMLGYQEVCKNYRSGATNRVILLTDGIANEGVVDPEQIARNSQRFNDQGIDLSTIGVGLELNKDLLRLLAQSGRGLFHFVADVQDIEKVFIDELQSLISPVAYNPNVEIDYGSDLELVQIYGYRPELRKNGVTLKLDNMNNGLTQVVLLRFRYAGNRPIPLRLPLKVRFTYDDLEKKQQIIRTEESFLTVNQGLSGDLLKDPEIAKNYSIALLAEAIRLMALECEARRYQEAEVLLTTAIDKTYRRYPNLDDADIKR